MLKTVATSGGQSKHLLAGLEKLEEAKSTVDTLSREAGEKKTLLSKKQKEASEAMKRIQVSMEQKAERKQEVEKLQARCAKDEQAITVRKGDVEGELGGVQPELEAAQAAVGELKSSNLNEIKGFRIPPEPVQHVLSAVMQFLGADDLSWAGMKRFLGNAGIITQILGFDARLVTPSMKAKVGKILAQYPASFEPSVIKRSSVACAPLAAWSIANLKYADILLKIEPLTSELDKLSAKLAQSTERVNECRAQLQQLDA